MKNNSSFVRKVVYLVAMAGLLIPLYLISAPSFLGPEGERSEGGVLTRLRDKHGLSQANLGEIDPASESMKLATLGMRGVAANLLWERANTYKKREEWDNLRATLNQIAKLQPNFISVWQFQAWNLSYNVSVEFDNYEHRYHWVKKGIEFLMQGIRYNTNEPRLLSDLGWFFGHKIGRSDEYIQFRRKYRTDSDFHESLDTQINVDEAKDWNDKPDNWLTAHQWFKKAQNVVDKKAVTIRGKNPLVFHSDSAKALIRYADAVENEGKFGDVAFLAWERADKSWFKYGQREIPTSYGYKISLNEGEKWLEKVGELGVQMEELAPGIRERLEKERYESLSDKEKRLLKADRADLDAADYEVALEADEKTKIVAEDIIAEIKDPAKRREAKLMANRIVEAAAYSTTIRRYREVVNFNYWKTRCIVEQEDRAIKAREFLWNANEKYEEADLLGALADYDESWKRWSTIHKDYQVLAEDVTAEDLVDHIKNYRKLLSQLDRDFPPPNFPMLQLVANYADDFGYSREETKQLVSDANALAAVGVGSNSGEAAVVDDAVADDDADSNLKSDDTGEASEESDTEGSEAPSETNDAAAPATVAMEMSGLMTAESLYRNSDLNGAKAAYETAFKSFKELDSLSDSDKTVLMKQIRQYRILVGQLNDSFPPKEFSLADFVKDNAVDFGYTSDEAAELFGE